MEAKQSEVNNVGNAELSLLENKSLLHFIVICSFSLNLGSIKFHFREQNNQLGFLQKAQKHICSPKYVFFLSFFYLILAANPFEVPLPKQLWPERPLTLVTLSRMKSCQQQGVLANASRNKGCKKRICFQKPD